MDPARDVGGATVSDAAATASAAKVCEEFSRMKHSTADSTCGPENGVLDEGLSAVCEQSPLKPFEHSQKLKSCRNACSSSSTQNQPEKEFLDGEVVFTVEEDMSVLSRLEYNKLIARMMDIERMRSVQPCFSSISFDGMLNERIFNLLHII